MRVTLTSKVHPGVTINSVLQTELQDGRFTVVAVNGFLLKDDWDVRYERLSHPRPVLAELKSGQVIEGYYDGESKLVVDSDGNRHHLIQDVERVFKAGGKTE